MRTHIFTLLIAYFFSMNSFAGALDTDLSKFSEYVKIRDSIKGDEQLNTGTTKIQEAIEEQKRIESDPNARAKLFYEKQVSKEPCSHCPKYLNLIEAVNKIVEKSKTETVAEENRQLIQLSKLKFLYYNTLTTMDDGSIKCNHQSGMDYFSERQFNKGKLTLAAEEALALPDVTDVQYYATGPREVHYYYRGEGLENDVVIEVVMGQGKTPIIRYYKYDNGFNLPTLDGSTGNRFQDPDNYAEFKPEIMTENMVLPTDISLGKAGAKFNLTEGVNLRFETNGSYNQQAGKVSFETDTGKKYLIVEGTNVINGSKGVNTIVNYGFDLDKDSGLAVDSSIETKLETSTDPQKLLDRSNKISLSLTDHNSEYFTVKGELDEAGAKKIGVSNSIKIGEGKTGVDYSIDRNMNSEIGLKASGYGLGETGLRVKNTNGGEEWIREAYWKTEIAKDLNLNLQTSYTSPLKYSSGLTLERSLNETDSIAFTVNNGKNEGQSDLSFVFQAKFKF